VPVVTVALDGALAATVAVKFTDWPLVEGFAEEPRVVVVVAGLTVSVENGELLAEKEGESGLYSALML
jgi:hypothetical protein